MQHIAAEMRVPGTSFVSPSPRRDSDSSLRMFTPALEMTYSGHTTLATVHVDLHRAAGRPSRVRVGGQAITILAGSLRLP